jgi:hypothetical protein
VLCASGYRNVHALNAHGCGESLTTNSSPVTLRQQTAVIPRWPFFFRVHFAAIDCDIRLSPENPDLQMLRSSMSDASAIDLHRYLSLGQVSGFEDDAQKPLPPPVPSRLSARVQLNLRPADAPIDRPDGSKGMLRAHAADARYWRPQTTGTARSSNSRPADAIRNKSASTLRESDAAAEQQRPHPAAAVSYMDNAAILAAMKQDKALWARVHSPSPAAVPDDKTKRQSAIAAKKQRPVVLPGRLDDPRPCSTGTHPPTSGVDVSISTPPRAPTSQDMKLSSDHLLSPSPSVSRELQSPSSSGPALKQSPAPPAAKAALPSHGGLISFLSLEHKRPHQQQQQQQYELEQAPAQQQATKIFSPKRAISGNEARTPLSSRNGARGPSTAAFSSPNNHKASPPSASKYFPSSALESRGHSGEASPGATSAGLERLVLE